MKTITLYLKLIRLEQWYKNLLIFAPLLFAPNVHPLTALVIGFFGFSCVSAITYIFNDWMDREKDRLHPIKKERPLASGKISGKKAIFMTLALLIIALFAGIQLGSFYGAIIFSYFLITNLYSLGLKNIPLLDIFIIALNFSLRMMAGLTSLPDITTLPYFGLLFGTIIIFLTHKRRSDIKLLKEKAIQHKPVLKFYSKRNNYIVRGIAYLLVIASLVMLWRNGLGIYKAFGFFVQLNMTSFIFSDNPEYTSKAHYLFKSKLWTGLLAINVLIFLDLI